MPSVLPIPEDDYRAPPAPSRMVLDRAVWDAVFGSVGSRLRALEDVNSGIETLKLELQNFGIQRLDEAINPLIEQTLAALAIAGDDLDQLRATLDQMLAGGLPASSVAVAPVSGLTAGNAQAAIAEVLDKIEDERSVTSQDIAVAVGAEAAARSSAINGLQASVNNALALTGSVDALRKDLLLTALQVAAASGDTLNMSAGVIDPYADASDITLFDASLNVDSKLVGFRRRPFLAAPSWSFISSNGLYDAYGYRGTTSGPSLSNIVQTLSMNPGASYGSWAVFGQAVGVTSWFVVERSAVTFPICAMEIITETSAASSWLIQVSNESGTVVYGQATVTGPSASGFGAVATADFTTQCNERRVRVSITRQSGSNSLNVNSIRLLGAVTADQSPAPTIARGFGNVDYISLIRSANSTLPTNATASSGAPNEVNINFSGSRLLSRIGIYGLSGLNVNHTFDLTGSNDGVAYDTITSGINIRTEEVSFGRMFDILLPDTAPAYARYRLTRTAGTTSFTILSMHLFDRGAVAGRITSSVFTAGATPSKLRLGAQVKRYNGAPLSDLLFDVSRDGGTTWTAVTVAKTADQADGFEFVEGIVDVTGQPIGSNARYRIRSQNNITADIGGAVLQWG